MIKQRLNLTQIPEMFLNLTVESKSCMLGSQVDLPFSPCPSKENIYIYMYTYILFIYLFIFSILGKIASPRTKVKNFGW